MHIRCRGPPDHRITRMQRARHGAPMMPGIRRTGIPEPVARLSAVRKTATSDRVPASTARKGAGPGLAPLPRSSTTSDLVVDAIRSAILAGRLGPPRVGAGGFAARAVRSHGLTLVVRTAQRRET